MLLKVVNTTTKGAVMNSPIPGNPSLTLNVPTRLSVHVAFTLLFILSHIAQGSGSAFKTWLIGLNPGFTNS